MSGTEDGKEGRERVRKELRERFNSIKVDESIERESKEDIARK